MTETEDYDKSATPTAHRESHQKDGSDEISVTNLSGELADKQPSQWDMIAEIPADLISLIENVIADALHRHSELVASDEDPDPALSIDADGNAGIGTPTPNAKLQVVGAISSETASLTASSDNFNVAGANTLFVDTTATAIILGGLTGGVLGQHLEVIYINDFTKTLTLEHNKATEFQKLFMHSGGNEVIDGGGMTFACDGTNWYDCGHGKHV